MALIKVGKNPGIYKNALKNGDTSYYYTYKDLGGNLHKVKVGLASAGITVTYAKNKRDERLNLLRNGEDPRKKKRVKLQFEDVWDFYVENAPMTDRVRSDRRGRWSKHMKEYFADEVTVEKLKQFRSDKLKKLNPSTVDMLMSFCGTAANFWNAEQKLLRMENSPSQSDIHNPMPDLRAFDKHRQKKEDKIKKVNRERFLSIDEINQLKEAVEDKPELNLFVHLALTTGARLGTVMSIQKKSIRGGKVTLINHKVGKEKYTGFIDDATQKLLDQRLPKLKANNTLFFDGTNSESNTRKIQRRLQYIMNKLFNGDLESNDTIHRVMVHTLRHTFASHLVMNGTPLVTVKELMGHKDINTTMIYAHLAPDAGKTVVMGLWS